MVKAIAKAIIPQKPMFKKININLYLPAVLTFVMATPLAVLAAVLPTTCSEMLTFLSGAVATTLAAFIGAIAIIMLLYGAFQFLTAGGDSEKIKDARHTITWAIVGIAVALISFNIPGILSSFLGGALPTTCQ